MGNRLVIVAALACAPLAASAQTGKNFDVQTMNFDIWCQEQAHLPPDRCDKRTPEDEATFEAFRDKIERYEIPYLQQKQNEVDFDRNVLHNDPVDRPLKDDPAAQQQAPDQPPRTPPP